MPTDYNKLMRGGLKVSLSLLPALEKLTAVFERKNREVTQCFVYGMGPLRSLRDFHFALSQVGHACDALRIADSTPIRRWIASKSLANLLEVKILLERLQSMIDHEQTPAEPRQIMLGIAQNEIQHGDDFRGVNWFGVRYEFTPQQAHAFRILFEHFQKGLPVHQTTIGGEIDSQADRYRLANTFRDRRGRPHPSWGTTIVPAGKGCYRLVRPKKVNE